MARLIIEVPDEAVMELLERVGLHLEQGVPVARANSLRSWEEGTEEERGKQALAYYGGATARGRKILDWLMDHPGEEATAYALNDALAFERSGGAWGAMSGLGTQAKRLGRKLPWHTGVSGAGMTMPAGWARIFRAARAAWLKQQELPMEADR